MSSRNIYFVNKCLKSNLLKLKHLNNLNIVKYISASNFSNKNGCKSMPDCSTQLRSEKPILKTLKLMNDQLGIKFHSNFKCRSPLILPIPYLYKYTLLNYQSWESQLGYVPLLYNSRRTVKKFAGPQHPDSHFEATPLKSEIPFWDSRENLIKDLEKTKEKVKEKVDEIIERENIWTIPNFLCVSRILASPILCYSVISSQYSLALGLFISAGFTDLIDGMIARKFPSQASRLGSFLDPLADKVLVASLFLTLTYVGLIPLMLTALIVYRDAVIIIGASYVRYKSLPPPHTLSRYFDATHATAQLAPTLMSKLNTAIQLSLITFSLAAPIFSFTDHYLLQCFCLITGITTVGSGIGYIFSKDTYKILSESKNK